MKKKETIKKQVSVEEMKAPAVVGETPEKAVEQKPEPTSAVEEEKQMFWLRKLFGRDARVAHFVVDVLAGKSPEEAVETYFPTKAAVDAQLAEAEQRGYLRGRNEAVALDMKERPLWNSDKHPDNPEHPNLSIPSILSRIRRSVWDK